MKTINSEEVFTAYRKLKRHIYYDKTDLSLRAKLAKFEASANFQNTLDGIAEVANGDTPHESSRFKGWVRQIGFRVVPKKLKEECDCDVRAKDSGRFISNANSASRYEVDRVNYFFDGPIELYLLVVLWIMREGWKLDAELGQECFGSRLNQRVGQPDDTSASLFAKYHERYARWRDTGLKIAQRLLSEEQTSVCILGLDLQEYYYRIRLDFEAVAKATASAVESDSIAVLFGDSLSKSGLLCCLEAICLNYRKVIDPLLHLTHEHLDDKDVGLPIGLPASPLLANWYLCRFDRRVKKKLRPAYYGRYVDDILLVLPTTEEPARLTEDPVGHFINSTLVESGLLTQRDKRVYELTTPKRLLLQQSKCILQYFDAKHSIAGLMKFKKKLEESGSDFRLLPVEEADSSLEDIAYDLLYEGSINKFRSVKGMAENRFELAKHLAKQTILHLYTNDPPDRDVSKGLLKFFKGRNAIEYFDLWERVFTYFAISGDEASSKQFGTVVRTEIAKIGHVAPEVARSLVGNLMLHFAQSKGMAEALQVRLGINEQGLAADFRRANLFRHQFVRIPLLDCTDYQGTVSTRDVRGVVTFDYDRARRSARYVAFDELVLLAESGVVETGKLAAFEWAQLCYRKLHEDRDPEGIMMETVSTPDEDQNNE